MNSKDFTTWLKGFVAASNSYNLTPAGWETLKEELSKVDSEDEIAKPEDDEELEDDFFFDFPKPNEDLIEAARRYKEVIDEYDDYGRRIYNKESRPTWYSTSTSDNLNN
jgi:DNA-binding PadR family transcriptional regulator